MSFLIKKYNICDVFKDFGANLLVGRLFLWEVAMCCADIIIARAIFCCLLGEKNI